MNSFLNLATNVLVLPLMIQIQRQPELWDENTLRTKFPNSPHSEVSDIWLMFNELPEKDVDFNQLPLALEGRGNSIFNVINDKEVIPYSAWSKLPAARSLIFDLMRNVNAIRLGRVMITKLAPGKRIPAHKDGGAPATYFTRYQIALHCLPGNQFRIEDETVEFATGDVWMIDNTKEHEVINNSSDDRIVMIVDLRSE